MYSVRPMDMSTFIVKFELFMANLGFIFGAYMLKQGTNKGKWFYEM